MSSLALQKGIEALLASSSSYDLPPVYDGVKASARYPYITLGRDKAVYEGAQMRVQSHIFVYSQAFSIREVKKVLSALMQLFSDDGLRVEGAQCVLMLVRSTEALRLSDGKTYRGELVLETILENQT